MNPLNSEHKCLTTDHQSNPKYAVEKGCKKTRLYMS
jgi:hypothetical protein